MSTAKGPHSLSLRQASLLTPALGPSEQNAASTKKQLPIGMWRREGLLPQCLDSRHRYRSTGVRSKEPSLRRTLCTLAASTKSELITGAMVLGGGALWIQS